MITNIATGYNLDPHLAMAIVQQESGGNPYAIRYEALWRYLVTPATFANSLHISAATETVLQSMSWGLMQVMGSVARELGFTDPMPKLCELEIGLQYGCKQLQRLAIRYPKLEDTIAAYNAGSPRRTTAGIYENQSYVDSVLNYIQLLQ